MQLLDPGRRPDGRFRFVLGLLVGSAGLIAMVRLVAGAFSGGPHLIVWLVTAAVLLSWVTYAGWRARRSRIGGRSAMAVLVLALIGLGLGWIGVGGAVLALACSFAGFTIIWWHDRPGRTRLPITLEDR